MRVDLTGQTFGKLTAVRFIAFRDKQTYWLFRCKCGSEVERRIDGVKSGRVKSCGCIRQEQPFADLAGKVFGRLTVLGLAFKRGKNRYWRCRCSCGNEANVPGRNLTTGKAKSCGCFQREKASAQGKKIGDANRRHGMTHTREYETWHGMMLRCYDENQPAYPRYGGRGITVCERWHAFENFFADMGLRPGQGYSLDRFPDPNGPYEPNNCRWATNKQQCRNKTTNVRITHDGKTLCIAEWAELSGMTTTLLWSRLQKGWDFAKAISTPPLPRSERRRVGRVLTKQRAAK